MGKDARNRDVRKLLLEDIDRRNVSVGVRKSAVEAIKQMSAKLLAGKRKKALLFFVLHAAHIDAGERRSVQSLAKELDLKGKVCNISPRVNLLQKQFAEEGSQRVLKTINITTADELVEKNAGKIEGINDTHLQEMQKLLTKIMTNTPTLHDMYPQKVSNAFIYIYCDMNGINIPTDVRTGKNHKLQRLLRAALEK